MSIEELLFSICMCVREDLVEQI